MKHNRSTKRRSRAGWYIWSAVTLFASLLVLLGVLALAYVYDAWLGWVVGG